MSKSQHIFVKITKCICSSCLHPRPCHSKKYCSPKNIAKCICLNLSKYLSNLKMHLFVLPDPNPTSQGPNCSLQNIGEYICLNRDIYLSQLQIYIFVNLA